MLKYNSNNKALARHNRRQRNATRQEGILWHTFLKKAKVKFYRQYRVDNYILDFYSPKIMLAIELDGSQHYEDEGIDYDNKRTETLQQFGISVLRFSNVDVDNNLFGVVAEIERMIEEKMRE